MVESKDALRRLVNELRALPDETEWVEFKVNNQAPEAIGEYVSALSNSAALCGKTLGYLVWGITDATHEVVGTAFKPNRAKKGNEPLENWLARQLNPGLHLEFHELDYEGKRVVLLEIPRATSAPVQFKGVVHVRIGSCCQALREHPHLEKELWRIFNAVPFEELLAREDVGTADVLDLLDAHGYFNLVGLAMPRAKKSILERLAAENFIVANRIGSWDITNLGAILLAKDLAKFKRLSRKVVRIIIYEGKGRTNTLREEMVPQGYAIGFESIINLIHSLLPSREVIGTVLRKQVSVLPAIAIRELVANGLIHQDFSVTGAGPMIEIFKDRLEVTNPGTPLVEPNRFLDSPPRSRNEDLASFMRRGGICEERGSGVDKVVDVTETDWLPAPSFQTSQGSTRAVLFTHKEWPEMDAESRIRACYLHACLRYVEHDQMTNASLRARFRIAPQNSAIISRIIRETIQEGLVKAYDSQQGKKYARYVPFWA